jgi:hypothetical protein
MRVVVDNSAGGDPDLAEEVARGLAAHGLDVEVRRPSPSAMFDTAVHLVSTGVAIRVYQPPDRATLATIEQAVRAALLRVPSLRRRTQSVPVSLGETGRVLEWIDLFE